MLLRGHEYEKGRVVALNTMFVKYIGKICFYIFWFVKELYIKLLYNCKTRENSNFLKNGKMVISVKIQNFSRSRMTKRTSPLESSRKI